MKSHFVPLFAMHSPPLRDLFLSTDNSWGMASQEVEGEIRWGLKAMAVMAAGMHPMPESWHSWQEFARGA